MLSKKEKEEILIDGLSVKRQKDFRQAGIAKDIRSLDDYIKFLMSIQKIFLYKSNFNHTVTKLNKL